MIYRDRKLLDLAHQVTECQLQLPGVCQGHSAHGCEPAHSNQQRHGKGMGHKAEDIFHVAACHACHASSTRAGASPRSRSGTSGSTAGSERSRSTCEMAG